MMIMNVNNAIIKKEHNRGMDQICKLSTTPMSFSFNLVPCAIIHFYYMCLYKSRHLMRCRDKLIAEGRSPRRPRPLRIDKSKVRERNPVVNYLNSKDRRVPCRSGRGEDLLAA